MLDVVAAEVLADVLAVESLDELLEPADSLVEDAELLLLVELLPRLSVL